MKAVFKKMIAVAFCAATAASMLSMGVSAASSDPWFADKTVTLGEFSENRTYQLEDNGQYYGDVYFYLTAQNWAGGKIEAKVSVPSNAKIVKYDWSGTNVNSKSGADAWYTTNSATSGQSFSAKCVVTVEYTAKRYVNGALVERKITDDISLTISSKQVYADEQSANLGHWNSHISTDGGYYNDKWYNRYDWDTSKIYWDGDYYWYYSGGRWYATSSYPGLPDRPSYRPSYSREYEVEWSGETFYYNGKVQLPTATITVGSRTIELDVKLISGDGKSVGTHRVRASLPRGYYNYDLTDTTLRYTIKEAQKEGFVTESGKTYYYENGKKVTGWKTIKGTDYYFLKDGAAAEGWEKIGPDTYYFSDGKMVTGWINDGANTYYCYNSGKMCHGRWHEIKGYWYYFDKSGAMITSDWIQDGNKWYYVAGDGRMATNTTVPGNYKVGKDGAWIQ